MDTTNTDTYVVLINERDEITGTMEKMEAHRQALLHRAVSVFLFNRQGEWLLQRRNLQKYHSGGLWTNTCCTHPVPHESYGEAAHRRLREEMGIRCVLHPIFRFLYKAELGNGLTEHELDTVFIGFTDESPAIDRNEVHEWKYVTSGQLSRHLETAADEYTVWFRHIYRKVEKYLINGIHRYDNQN